MKSILPRQVLHSVYLVVFWVIAHTVVAQQGPPGFATTQFGQRIPGTAIDIDFDAANRMYNCEKSGRVWVTINGVRANNALLDLREEIDSYSDRGLLGLALDPNFSQNGYVYLSYTVDQHYLLYFGTPTYNAATNQVGASVLRVTRYTVSPTSLTATNPNNMAIVANSRQVLLGETKTTGAPILDGSHAGGDLAFGADGTLLVSTGDGAGLNGRDVGGAGNPGYGSPFWQEALDLGIMPFWENIGAYRSQYLDSFCGKILRLDPLTGDGLPSNPYYDPANPRSARSRVFASGLRNPYRMSMRPGTGSTNPADGNPGSLYIGDVGWNRYEELHVMKRAGQNFGWPFYEGMSFVEGRSEFYPVPPNKIINADDSTQNIYYNRLPNPNDSTALFSKPEISIGHQSQGTWYLQHGMPVRLPDLNLPYNNVSMSSSAIIDGGWTGAHSTMPTKYHNKYFFGDYFREWLAYAEFDSEDNPLMIDHFAQGFNGLNHLVINPNDSRLYLFYWFSLDIFRLESTINQPPVVSLKADKLFGPSSLTVAFDGSASTDPENTALTYAWNFGDGSPVSTLPSPTHGFTATGVRAYTVTLTVTDAGGASAQQTKLISVNNTPPVIQSTSLDNLTLVAPLTTTPAFLSAVVTDAEHTAGQLTYRWQVLHMHNDHGHADEPITTPTTPLTLEALGTCSGLESYWYRVTLTVTDAAGLSTTVNKDIYPNCAGTLQAITFPMPATRPKTSPPFQPSVWSSSGLPITLYIVGGPAFMEGSAIRLTGNPGVVTVRALQHGNGAYRPAPVIEQTFTVSDAQAVADLGLSVVFGNRIAALDSPVPALLTITNNGPDVATNVLIKSQLPTNLSFVSSASLVHQNGVVSGTIGSIQAGNSETVELLVQPTQAGTYRLAAEVNASPAFDPDSQPNTGTSDGEDDAAQADLRTVAESNAVFVSPNPTPRLLPAVASNQPAPTPNRVDLSLTLQTDRRTAAVGEPLSLTLLITNDGSLTATNVVVRDTLRLLTLGTSPAFAVVSSGADYSVIEATIATLAPGQSAALTFSVLPTSAGLVQTTAQIWSVGNPGPNVPADADSTPGNGTQNGEDDCALLDWRIR